MSDSEQNPSNSRQPSPAAAGRKPALPGPRPTVTSPLTWHGGFPIMRLCALGRGARLCRTRLPRSPQRLQCCCTAVLGSVSWGGRNSSRASNLLAGRRSLSLVRSPSVSQRFSLFAPPASDAIVTAAHVWGQDHSYVPSERFSPRRGDAVSPSCLCKESYSWSHSIQLDARFYVSAIVRQEPAGASGA